MTTFEINGRVIGPGRPVYIIAELSANHGGSFDQAVTLVRAARESGADAIKLQTYTPETLTLDSDRDFFRVGEGSLWQGRTLYDLYREAHTPWEWQPRLKVIANELGMDLFSSPFDETAVDFLEKMEVPAYKIASFELIDLPLIRYVATKGRPIILSTGMATSSEIEDAVRTIRETSRSPIALLKCTSAYPAPPEEMHLRSIPRLAETFRVATGLSDHTLGIAVPVAAVSLGACLIEKHMTLSRAVPGPDSAFSLEPGEFKAMVEAVRVAEKSLGNTEGDPAGKGHESKSRIFRRSLFVVRDVKAGEIFTPQNVRSIRPAHGLPPKFLPDVLGKKAVCNISRGTPLDWEMIAGCELGRHDL